jgi:hypothetical protein
VRLGKFTVRASGPAIVVFLFLLPACNISAEAQSEPSPETDKVDVATVRSMLKRIAELEAEVKELKAAKTEQAAGDNAVTRPVPPQEVSAAASPDVLMWS